jgi:FkbM family methyltransferase
MNEVKEVTHNGTNLKLSVPNRLCVWRVNTFSTKEPETLGWIDYLPKGSVVWDIGANIGLYSIYAAKKRNIQVWAFEPSVFNLETLARNIYLNNLSMNICILPFALSDKNGSSQMRLTTTEWGGALSTFDQTFGWDGKDIRQIFEYQTYGLKADDVVNMLSIPIPEYIKMDVDGLEHFILKGSTNVLQNIKEILIEVNDDFTEQAESCKKLLTEAGLVLKDKLHSDMIATSTAGFQNSYNQIWIRS